MLSKEDFELLQPYEYHLECALKDYCSRVLPTKDLELLKSIYIRTFGVYDIKISCTACVLKMLKKLGNERHRFIDQEQRDTDTDIESSVVVEERGSIKPTNRRTSKKRSSEDVDGEI